MGRGGNLLYQRNPSPGKTELVLPKLSKESEALQWLGEINLLISSFSLFTEKDRQRLIEEIKEVMPVVCESLFSEEVASNWKALFAIAHLLFAHLETQQTLRTLQFVSKSLLDAHPVLNNNLLEIFNILRPVGGRKMRYERSDGELHYVKATGKVICGAQLLDAVSTNEYSLQLRRRICDKCYLQRDDNPSWETVPYSIFKRRIIKQAIKQLEGLPRSGTFQLDLAIQTSVDKFLINANNITSSQVILERVKMRDATVFLHPGLETGVKDF